MECGFRNVTMEHCCCFLPDHRSKRMHECGTRCTFAEILSLASLFFAFSLILLNVGLVLNRPDHHAAGAQMRAATEWIAKLGFGDHHVARQPLSATATSAASKSRGCFRCGCSEVCCSRWFMNFYAETKQRGQRPVECICQTRQVVFVPWGWWHGVINLEESIAITQNFVSREVLARLQCQCSQCSPGSQGIQA